MNPTYFQFESTEERDRFLDEHFPERQALDVPGFYGLPAGDRLGVHEKIVTWYPPEKIEAGTG